MKKFSKEDIKPEMIESAKLVFVAMALVESIKLIVVANQNSVLAKHQFLSVKDIPGEQSVVILDEKSSYLMNDDNFKVYCSEVEKLNLEAGLPKQKPGCCPLLVAEHDCRKAIWLMFDTFEPLAGISSSDLCGSLKNYAKGRDLYLGLVASLENLKADEVIADLVNKK